MDGPFYDLWIVYGDKLLFLGQENSGRGTMRFEAMSDRMGKFLANLLANNINLLL
ncbi:MAG: hypothetical protein ABR988_07790 [Terriglobales bacterium]